MIDELRFVLRCRPILWILALSATLRIVFFFSLPETPSYLGPDEGTYARLAKYISEGKLVSEFPLFGPSLYYSSKSLVIPSSVLIRLGFDEIDAVRLIASTYGLTSSLLLILCYFSFLRTRGVALKEFPDSLNLKFFMALILFSFLPSNFIWSVLGLRESATQFWIIASFYSLLKLWQVRKHQVWKPMLAVVLTITFSFGARPQTSLVFCLIAVSVCLILLSRNSKIASSVCLSAVLGGLFLGLQFSSPPTVPTVPTVPTAKLGDIAKLGDKILQGMAASRNVKTEGANSKLKSSLCAKQSYDFFSRLDCTISELPYYLFSFLFRPMLYFDQGTNLLLFASIENIVWTLILLTALWSSLKRELRGSSKFVAVSVLSYIVTFSTLAALHEGNLGTAFRHKSSILWPTVFILLVAHKLQPNIRTLRHLTK